MWAGCGSAFQQQMHDTTAPHAEGNIAIFGVGGVSAHDRAVFCMPESFVCDFAFEASAADGSCAATVGSDQHARAWFTVPGAFNCDDRGEDVLRLRSMEVVPERQ
jgi:hypothetical protein